MIDIESIVFGQKHLKFDYENYNTAKKIQKLARKHRRMCEMDCNGEGWIKGNFYRCDSVNGFIDGDNEKTVFLAEIESIEEKIETLIKNSAFTVEFQRDPRGSTVRLKYENDTVDIW